MNYTKYPRGSEWRKWDLHVHTPFTKLNNQYPTDENVWYAFCDEIEKSDVMVFGITDYFSVENYFTFVEKHKTRYPDSQKIFFPNIELRLEVSVNRNAEEVNLHIIFSNEIKKEKITLFLSKFNTNISRNGALIPCNDLSTKIDFESAGIDYKILRQTLSEVFGNNECYLIIAAANNAGLRPDNKSPRKLNITDEIDKICDAFFGGQQNCDYYLDINRYEDDYDEEAKQKPVVSGCDAHSFAELKKYLGKRFVRQNNNNEIIEKDVTWIKADPTFEGLKQIIFEPEGRVKIQEEKPEKKKPYSVIEAVRFIDKRNNSEFSEEWIFLNQNLNSIIGGKSSGKSLLLYHIAKTIDPERMDEINKDKEHRKLKYDFEDDSLFDFEVKWSDGGAYRFQDENIPTRPITYIPQLYLNLLAEVKKAELNKLVENMLLESDADYKIYREKKKDQIQNLKTEISSLIDGYYRTKNNLEIKNNELKELGDKKAIEKNIRNTKADIDKLRLESEFSEDEEKQYKKLQENISAIKCDITDSDEVIEILEFGKSELTIFKKSISKLVVEDILDKAKTQFPILTSKVTEKLSKILGKFSEEMVQVLNQKLLSEFTVLEEEQKNKDDLKAQLNKLNKDFIPFNEKIKNGKQFEILQKDKENEEKKLKAINDKEKGIKILLDGLSTELFLKKYGDLFNNYCEIVEENKRYNNIPDADQLELASRVEIKHSDFEQNFLAKINKKKSLKSQFGNFFNGNTQYQFNPENHLKNIKVMIEKVTSGEAEFNQGFGESQVMYSLLDDYYFIDYDLLQDGDRLINMSPGKMGIILFQLFLHLSKSKNPILIDQPEDNLDNRTVYKKLNDFIKKKKIDRQIIIVSHNANIVVSTDSENIIIANQSGQGNSNENSKYKFEYVNGSIEHSFFFDKSKNGILYKMGIREHVCDILEGGREAFEKRENKYGFR